MMSKKGSYFELKFQIISRLSRLSCSSKIFLCHTVFIHGTGPVDFARGSSGVTKAAMLDSVPRNSRCTSTCWSLEVFSLEMTMVGQL